MNRKEKQRYEWLLLFTAGAWNTFESWTKVLFPFILWSLNPRPDFDQMIYIQGFSAFCTFVGIFLIAYLIENYGLRRTGIFCIILTTIYQANLNNIKDYSAFHLLQLLLVANHIPMVIDSTIAYLEGEDGNDKKRTRMFNRLTIPISFGIAAGPYLALQVMFYLTSSLDYSQMMCAFLHAVCALRTIMTRIEMKYETELLNSYVNIIQHEKTKFCLILLLMVLGPYAAYEQVIRILMTGTVIRNPHQLSRLFFVLGGTTISVNLFLLPQLQKKYGPRQILYGAFGLLGASYIYLAHTTEYTTLLIGMPVQVVGVSLCMGELPSQILANAGKSNSGKAAALIRIAHMLGYLMTPIITGLTVDHDETTLLCYFSAIVSLGAIPILHKYCHFLQSHSVLLPGLVTVEKFD